MVPTLLCNVVCQEQCMDVFCACMFSMYVACKLINCVYKYCTVYAKLRDSVYLNTIVFFLS